MNRNWKIALIVVGSVVLVLVIAGVVALVWATGGMSTVTKLSIGKVDLSRVPDGTYRGSYSNGRWSNTVAVTVKDHRITGVKIVKDVTFKMDAKMQQLFDRVVKQQSPAVDAISGATATSKAFLESIQNALTGELKPVDE